MSLEGSVEDVKVVGKRAVAINVARRPPFFYDASYGHVFTEKLIILIVKMVHGLFPLMGYRYYLKFSREIALMRWNGRVKRCYRIIIGEAGHERAVQIHGLTL